MKPRIVWTRQDTLGIANHECVRCHGLGLKGGRLESTEPCPCVLRAIFRACYAKFRELVECPDSIEESIGPGARKEDYMVDFVSVARRTLEEDSRLWNLFRAHFLLGASAKMCIDRYSIDRGAFFHAAAEIEQRVGRALRETQPHALYPIDEYFRLANAKR